MVFYGVLMVSDCLRRCSLHKVSDILPQAGFCCMDSLIQLHDMALTAYSYSLGKILQKMTASDILFPGTDLLETVYRSHLTVLVPLRNPASGLHPPDFPEIFIHLPCIQ